MAINLLSSKFFKHYIGNNKYFHSLSQAFFTSRHHTNKLGDMQARS